MDELARYLADDKTSGRRAARFAAQAKWLRENVVAGQRDSSGNSVEQIIRHLEKAAASK